jgi:hypothetical protein
VLVAGAPLGLQNRGEFCISPNSPSLLRKATRSLAAQGKRAAPNSALPAVPADPDPADVVADWPDLPEAIKAGILAMVKAFKPES